MKKDYSKTKWVDGKTRVNAANLGKIEDALAYLHSDALGKDQIEAGSGIDITTNSKGTKVIGVNDEVLKSGTCKRIEFVYEVPGNFDLSTLYIVLDETTHKLKELSIGRTVIFKNEHGGEDTND